MIILNNVHSSKNVLLDKQEMHRNISRRKVNSNLINKFSIKLRENSI